MIDEDARVFSLRNKPTDEGWVLQRLCRSNFIGNGSSMLLRRSAFAAACGFDPSLRAMSAQGCEDMLMGLRIAEQFEFRVVPQHLVGYRITATNMSSDGVQMLRSCEIVLAEFGEKYPGYRRELDAHLVDMLEWLAVRALVGGRFSAASDAAEEVLCDGTGCCDLPLTQHAGRILQGQIGSSMAQGAREAHAKRQDRVSATL